MTVAEMEQRLLALEGTVARIVEGLPPPLLPATGHEEEVTEEDILLPGVEYPVVLSVSPKKVYHFRGKIVSLNKGPRGLSLSDSEWANLQEGEDA